MENSKQNITTPPVNLLFIRNIIEKQLTKHPDIKFGGSAGTGLTEEYNYADVDILINGRLFNIRIQPR